MNHSESVDGRRLAGQVAVVTGASRGIGRAISLRYGSEGAAVVCAGRSREDNEATARLLDAVGATAYPLVCDVTSGEDVARLYELATDRFGMVDTVVNNAGTHVVGRFEDFEVSDWEHVLDVNVLGAVRVTQAFLPDMLEAGRGRIINIASTAGKYGSLYQSPYNASKHAIVGLTRCLALETADHGVRVNAICPGFVETELIDGASNDLAVLLGLPPSEVIPKLLERVPIRRLLDAEEVAELAVYLASPLADGMTGQAISLAGGLILI